MNHEPRPTSTPDSIQLLNISSSISRMLRWNASGCSSWLTFSQCCKPTPRRKKVSYLFYFIYFADCECEKERYESACKGKKLTNMPAAGGFQLTTSRGR